MKLSIRKFTEVKFIDFHTHRHGSAPDTLKIVSVELADLKDLALENIDNCFFSIGMHPWRLPGNTANIKNDFRSLCKVLRISEVIALGEVGLDRLAGPDLDVQKAYLLGGMILAGEFDKPVIIHCVRSYPELIFLKKRFAPAVNALIHGYNNNVQIFEQLLNHGCYISFGLAGLNRADICDYIRQKPETLHRICLETDDSDLNIEDIYNQAVQAFKIDIGELSGLMKNNFISFFQVENNA